jgi:hypothetical protein
MFSSYLLDLTRFDCRAGIFTLGGRNPLQNAITSCTNERRQRSAPQILCTKHVQIYSTTLWRICLAPMAPLILKKFDFYQ